MNDPTLIEFGKDQTQDRGPQNCKACLNIGCAANGIWDSPIGYCFGYEPADANKESDRD